MVPWDVGAIRVENPTSLSQGTHRCCKYDWTLKKSFSVRSAVTRQTMMLRAWTDSFLVVFKPGYQDCGSLYEVLMTTFSTVLRTKQSLCVFPLWGRFH